MKFHITLTAAALAVTACGSHKEASTGPGYSDSASEIAVMSPTGGGSRVMPKARIYKTSAPSDSLVPVTVSHGAVSSYPAPSDLGQLPVRLADGWLLDLRGISAQSVFTTYTYDVYRSLPSAPSPSELLRAVNPSVSVTEIVELPFFSGDVTVEKADSLINAGLPGCKIMFKR